MSDFALDWLRLREPADLAARSSALARNFAAASPRPLRIADLGSGSGANARALMPRLAGDQDWILVDRDRTLIAAQEPEFTHWARRQGYPILAGGGRIAITVGASRWTAASMPLDLAGNLAALNRLDIGAVTAAAFFDLVSAEWLTRFVDVLARRQLPLLAVLTVDGVRDWQPAHDADAIVGDAFRHHQIRDKGFGAALGGAAADALDKCLVDRGFAVSAAASPWRLGGRDHTLLTALVAGEADAACEAAPGQADAIAAWRAARLAALADGGLALTVGHRDILALPG